MESYCEALMQSLAEMCGEVKEKSRLKFQAAFAVWTRLELATLGVTGRYSNQLNYHTFLL